MFDAVTGVVGSVCLLIGILIGTLMPRYERRVVREAPAPADLGYDPTNPMNRGRTPETVEICGLEWTVIRAE